MKYAGVIFLLILSIYPFSYARYNWKNKNKLGAIGIILLIVAQISFPAVLLFTR